MEEICKHIEQIETIKFPKKRECEECIKSGSEWVHLRTCQTCAVTLCCDSSPNKHASRHFLSSTHPVVISAEHGERWLWCYADESYADY
jgi:uncharacterized UBP type Zn finger protein